MSDEPKTDNVEQLGDLGLGLDPRTFLLKLAEKSDVFESVCVVVRYKDGARGAMSTNSDPWFWFACAGIMTDVALHGNEDDIIR